jgi:cellulose synthase (UDP-forming)
MSSTPLSSIASRQASRRTFSRPQIATLVMLGIILVSAAIAAAWFSGQGSINKIFQQLNVLQENPPLWLEVPMITTGFLLVPTIALFLIVLLVMRISAQPSPWSRVLVVSILLALTIRYMLWRSLTTLNLSTPLNGVFSIGLFAMELLVFFNGAIQLFLMLRVRDRHEEADQVSQAVISGDYLPTIDVMVPTYDEPDFILKRTIIGCQAMDYPHKTIYLLDDTRRPEIEQLAQELGCEYLTRPDNRFAKAGNLNHALGRTQGELLVIFDADFVPTTNFLTRTVGFFQNHEVALVQTPQSFYNPDPIARNLGLEDILTPEEEVFYRQIQPIRDGAGSVICSGTSFVIRRQALEQTGGFVTDSLSEDYFTGIRLSAQGYKLIYLNEKLSAGLAAENITAHAIQRLRWARGTLQAFFIKANPLTIPGLTILQRLAHLEGLLHWFTSLSRVVFLLMPLAYSFLGVIPLRATEQELLYFFLPYYLVQLSVFSWLNYRSRSALLSDIYSLVLCFPLAVTVLKVMLNPFSKGFQVTPKGTSSDRFSFNWGLALPLILLFIATAVSLWFNFGICMIKGAWMATVPPDVAIQVKGVGLGWIWSTYNLILVGIALLILLDVPRPHPYEWFALHRTTKVTLMGTDQVFWGFTTKLSEVGAEIALTQKGFPQVSAEAPLPIQIEIPEHQFCFTAQAIRIGQEGDFPTIQVVSDRLSLQQERQLTELLFCRPGQWQTRPSPGELRSLLILFRILLKPRVLFDRNLDVSTVSVAQV